jgi:signal transduction histidine kinase
MQRQDVVIHQSSCNVRMLTEKSVEVHHDAIFSKEIYIKNSISEALDVFADENMLMTVFRNLVSNAVKFTPRGGNILLQANTDENGMVHIKVRDTGIGMPHEIIADLYRLDKKTSRRGTENEPSSGLGLILCKEFVEKNNGQILVESIVNKGTTFTVILPSAALNAPQ